MVGTADDRADARRLLHQHHAAMAADIVEHPLTWRRPCREAARSGDAEMVDRQRVAGLRECPWQSRCRPSLRSKTSWRRSRWKCPLIGVAAVRQARWPRRSAGRSAPDPLLDIADPHPSRTSCVGHGPRSRIDAVVYSMAHARSISVRWRRAKNASCSFNASVKAVVRSIPSCGLEPPLTRCGMGRRLG